MGSCISSSNPKKKYLDDNPDQQRQNFPPQDHTKQIKQKQRTLKSSSNSKKGSNDQTKVYKYKNPLFMQSTQQSTYEQYRNLRTEQNRSLQSPKRLPQKQKNLKSKNQTKYSTSTYDTNKLNNGKQNSQGFERHEKGMFIEEQERILQQARILQIIKRSKRVSKVYRSICEKMIKYNKEQFNQ